MADDYYPDDMPLSERIKLLDEERVLTTESPESQTQRLFRENVVGAAYSIVDLALNSPSERLRLNAAQYVVERAIGRVQDNPPAPPVDPFTDLLAQCVVEQEDGA